MPASQRSLRLTDAYRTRLLATRERLQAQAERIWPTIEALDSTDWPERMAAATTQAQVEAIRVSAAYLSAYLTTETGRRSSPPAIDSRAYVGKSRDGRPLTESLRSPLIGTLGKLKQGLSAAESLSYGLNRATRMVGIDFDDAHRTALMEAIDSDDRFDGWQRALAGTCGACASTASGVSHDLRFPVHPGCQCVSEPVVKGKGKADRARLERATTRKPYPEYKEAPTVSEALAAEGDLLSLPPELRRAASARHDVMEVFSAEELRSGQVTVYRAVDAGGSLRPGDWVTPLRSYAEKLFPGRRIISEKVPTENLAHYTRNEFFTVGPRRLTGKQIFDAKTKAGQDEMLGPEAAALVREGKISLADLLDKSPLKHGEDFITQKPIQAIQ